MRLLFVCVGNSCRSQMAEGIARHLGHEAASAGTHPAREVSAHALTILAAKGIDTSTLNPKSVDLFNAEDFDMVISMGCGVSCPAMRIDQDWGLDDPVGQSLSVFEETAKEIEKRLKLLE
ncbi:MAG: arsenate reductase ArsC [Candidatus Poseidoniaceae archaeon]|nr:arsenate reductase ArsC [Candidatus Poseidoniaceae archaeon]